MSDDNDTNADEEESFPYAVVKFINENDDEEQQDTTVSEIPINWLFNNNKNCWWPPSKNVSTYISMSVTPNPKTWEKNKVIVENFCRSLTSARKKAENFNYTSSEEDTLKKFRKSHKKKFPCEDWADDNSSNSELPSKQKRKSISPPPSMTSLEHHEQTAGTIDINDLPVLFAEDVDVTEISAGNGAEDEDDNTAEGVSNISRSSCENVTPTSSVSILKSQCNCNSSKILRQILDIVTELKLQMKELQQTSVHNNCHLPLTDNNTLEIIKIFLPIANLETLATFEELLEIEENKAKFQRFVNMIGGMGPKDNIIRIYKQVYSDDMAVRCSWLGYRKNVRICDKISILVVKGVIMNTHNLRENEFETISSEWFRHAKQRLDRRK